MNYIVGLGNPDEKYQETRHNVGRKIVFDFARKNKFEDFVFDKKVNALVSEGKIGKEKVMLILPETYMNRSGLALKKIVSSKKKAEKMLVVYDDLDLGLGTVRLSFNRGSGGHRGIDSVIKVMGTKEFPRMRVGTSPITPAGKVKKPLGEEKVEKHVLSKFSPKEESVLKKVIKNGVESIGLVIEKGYLVAMNEVNSK